MIISIAHQKGGVGKSTIAFNLAYYLAEYKPVLIDLDIQSTISVVNKLRAKNRPPLDITTINSDAELKQIIKSSNDNNLFIIDTGGFDYSLNRISILAADLILTPISDRVFELLGLKKFESILKDLSQITKNTIKANVVLNDVSPAMKRFDDLASFVNNSAHFGLISSIIRQRADIPHSLGKGWAVGEYSQGSKADIEFMALADEVKQLLGVNNG
jgi:chromosome partitioning protein